MTIEPITPAKTVIAQENKDNNVAKSGIVNANEELAGEKLTNQRLSDTKGANDNSNMNDIKNVEAVDVKA
ncbi:MAG: hypothetical protein FWH22_07280 [Fibromonadales bacterium]|nr:hypothetical protein [Fibromonadales bacterium]